MSFAFSSVALLSGTLSDSAAVPVVLANCAVSWWGTVVVDAVGVVVEGSVDLGVVVGAVVEGPVDVVVVVGATEGSWLLTLAALG